MPPVMSSGTAVPRRKKPEYQARPARTASKGADTRADHHTDQREKQKAYFIPHSLHSTKGHRDAGIHGKRDHKAFQN